MATANGNGALKAPGKNATTEETKENIFMFYPNLIGMSGLFLSILKSDSDIYSAGYARIVLGNELPSSRSVRS